MNFKGILFAPGIFLALLGGTGFGQFKASGYLALQFEKGDSQSDFPDGTFRRSQAGLVVTGQTGNLFFYNLEARLKSETQVALEEAWVAIQPSAAFNLKMGLYLVPFGKYNRSNRPHETLFIQTPLHLGILYPTSWRDIGLLAEGRISFFSYSTYMGNGLGEASELRGGQQFEDNNADKARGGRAGLFLSESFEVGASYYWGKYDEENSRRLILQGVDVTWNDDPFLFVYEYGKALADNPADYPRGVTEGHFFLLSLRIGSFSPLVSYQKLSLDDSYHGSGFEAGVRPGSGVSGRLSRWACGIVYTPAAGLLFKIEYDFNRETDGSLQNDVFLGQVAIRF